MEKNGNPSLFRLSLQCSGVKVTFFDGVERTIYLFLYFVAATLGAEHFTLALDLCELAFNSHAGHTSSVSKQTALSI